MQELMIETKKREEIIDITSRILKLVEESKTIEGLCLVYVPHATAAITINENADPNIALDFLEALNKLIPRGKWRHDEIDNNGAAHIKSAIIGSSIIIPIKNSSLLLGMWQGIMLCEFDGPRKRKVIVKIIKS